MRSPVLSSHFVVLLFVLSLPFWLLGALLGSLSTANVPVNLPVSALMAVNPLIAAIILTYRQGGWTAVKLLLKRGLDASSIQPRRWWWPLIGLMPLIMLTEYALMGLLGTTPPNPVVPLAYLPVMIIVFFGFALCEEIGWQGYLYDHLSVRLKPLSAALLIGVAWAIWHIIPYIQTGNPPLWILWQCFVTVGLRVIIVWLYINTHRSLFAAIVFHAMINVSTFMFPNYGSSYDPFLTALLLTLTIIIITYSDSRLLGRKQVIYE